MIFQKEWLQDLVDGEHEDVKVVRDEIFQTRRWSTDYEIIFEFNKKLYWTTYSRGSTEMQDESPFENEPDEIECHEMERFLTTIVDYRMKKENE